MSAKREQGFPPAMSRPKQPNIPAGWHSRGYLPHFDGGEIPQFITFRLADSMPQKLLDRWREELSSDQNVNVDAALRKRIELFLDQFRKREAT